jgi:hypothetical protein
VNKGVGVTDLKANVKQFFEEYQKANIDFEIQRIAASYADVFMFADPKGVRSVKKEDFLKILPRRKDFFKSLGLVSSIIESTDASKLDSHYILVKTVWKMRFERNTDEVIDCRNLATYILAVSGDSFEIVFQLDHQDLMEKARELGLTTDLQKQ